MFFMFKRFVQKWKKASTLIMLFIAALYSSFRFIIPMNPSPDLAGGEKNSDRNSFLYTQNAIS